MRLTRRCTARGVQNFVATIASTQLTRAARDEESGGPASDQLATMEKVRFGVLF